jgi:hypothetical protein
MSNYLEQIWYSKAVLILNLKPEVEVSGQPRVPIC